MPPHVTKKRPSSSKDWDGMRATIEYLYSIEGKKLSELMTIMENEYGFVATWVNVIFFFNMSQRAVFELTTLFRQRQYKRQLGIWQVEKKVKKDEMRKILQIQKRRRELDGKETAFIVRNQVVTQEKITRFVRRTHVKADLHSPACEYILPTKRKWCFMVSVY
ncbi:uncharacterized protein ColSpa_10823 [Colletotrichum spaethianum]|uniref:Clr5 domain-containing protein n=1 Tax=Colletotrichum spaethianum TaxID=700344 RepID=A0AA37URF6_9PEZI|nr:uncharacterized protein ColSpa_10823 [Colletotrichum spaethianum]GKT50642.1 hypothetical protein ColSpa_10823 [Colletotrichum spaethianum]